MDSYRIGFDYSNDEYSPPYVEDYGIVLEDSREDHDRGFRCGVPHHPRITARDNPSSTKMGAGIRETFAGPGPLPPQFPEDTKMRMNDITVQNVGAGAQPYVNNSRNPDQLRDGQFPFKKIKEAFTALETQMGRDVLMVNSIQLILLVILVVLSAIQLICTLVSMRGGGGKSVMLVRSPSQ